MVQTPVSAPIAAMTVLAVCSPCLARNMKTSKAQPPAPAQDLLGVRVVIEENQIMVCPSASRTSKVTALIDSALLSNGLSAHDAQTLAGKLAFLSTTVFGQVGRAALKPVYARGHNVGENNHGRLTSALRRALMLMRYIINNAKPRIKPLQVHPLQCQHAVVYIDAFFQLGSTIHKTSADTVHPQWSLAKRFGVRG